MLLPLIGFMTEDFRKAFLKRCVTIICGENAFYVRPPSEDMATPIFRFSDDDAHKDFLDPGHKRFFGCWKKGQDTTYDEFNAAVQEEQTTIENVLSVTDSLSDEKEMVKWWIDIVVGYTQPMPTRVIPCTPSQANDALHVAPSPHGGYSFPVPPVSTGSNRRSRFVFPGQSGGSSTVFCGPANPEAGQTPIVKLEQRTDESRFEAAHQQLGDTGPIMVDASPDRKRPREPEAEVDIEKELEDMIDAGVKTEAMGVKNPGADSD